MFCPLNFQTRLMMCTFFRTEQNITSEWMPHCVIVTYSRCVNCERTMKHSNSHFYGETLLQENQ